MGLRVVIPVAGEGTRLRPHTFALPKVLVPVAGKPMLGHILTELEAFDVDEVTLVIGYRGDQVREYVTGAFSHKFRFVVQEQMLGLGHAIWMTKPEAGAEPQGPLLIILGDTLFDADLGKILNSTDSWIGVKEVEDPRRFGVVALDGDRITEMIEKPADPPTKLASVGIYLLQEPAALYAALDKLVAEDRRTANEIQLTDALQDLIAAGATLKPFEIDEWWDCGKPETLLDTNRRMLDRDARRGLDSATPTIEGSVIVPPVFIDGAATVEDSTIGPHVSIGPGAEVRGSTLSDSIISAKVRITSSQLKGSIIGESATVQGATGTLNIGNEAEVDLICES